MHMKLVPYIGFVRKICSFNFYKSLSCLRTLPEIKNRHMLRFYSDCNYLTIIVQESSRSFTSYTAFVVLSCITFRLYIFLSIKDYKTGVGLRYEHLAQINE